MIAILNNKTGSLEYLCEDQDELGAIRDCIYHGAEDLYEKEIHSLRHLRETMGEARDMIAMTSGALQVI